MNDPEKHYNAILRLHDKMDSLIEKTNDLSVEVAKLPIGVIFTRLKIMEKIVYTAVGIVLIAFMVSVAGDSPKKVTASTTQTIMHKVKK